MPGAQFKNIYQGRKVFITGHTGFKGSWLSLWLSTLGAKIIGYSIGIPTNPSHFELLKLNCTSIIDDVLHKDKLSEAIQSHQPDIVFHLAAQPLVRKSYQDPVLTFETNIMGTVNLLESCRQVQSVRAVVNVTSDKCYDNTGSSRAFKEDDPLGGYDPYSASKGAAEIAANAYRNSFFNTRDFGKTHSTLLADVRAGNVIGGGDWASDRLIPDLARAASNNKVVSVRNPQATRPWQHVLESLSGYLSLGSKLMAGEKQFSGNWNFAPTETAAVTVSQILKQAHEHWDKVRYQAREDSTRFYEADLLALDASKARQELQWQNIWNIRKTLAKTVSWYRAYYEQDLVSSLNDLDEYVYDAKKASVAWTKL